jgi:uncharacterized protein (DUF305 family)
MSLKNRPTRRLLALLTPTLLAAAVLAGCGGDDSGGAVQRPPGEEVDRAFVAEMIPHHQSAVQMAEVALERGHSRFVKKLAGDIVRTQNEEITVMRRIDQDLAAGGVGRGELGMQAHEMGMDMDASELQSLRPFDRAFIDAMVPHHQGAIRMARMEIERGQNPDLKRLATAIVDAQAREIREMNEQRERRFGAASPAGGIPGEASGGMSGEEHAGK